MNKYKNKYRTQTFRANWWNYGWGGAYFITICTKDREHYFGYVASGEMNLNHSGLVAEKIWKEIPDHFPFAKLDEFVIMPNHIHGILILESGPVEEASPKKSGGFAGNKNPMLHDNLSRIIRWYKGRCTFEIRRLSGTLKEQEQLIVATIIDN
jgi:putative transposase